MIWPSVSIVITSLNRAAFIERTILSIVRQEYLGPVQVIVADGGSTDGTVEILKKYPQVEWWSHEDNGIVDAANRGLAAASGEFVAIQDSDNFYLQDAFRLTMDFARRNRDYDIVTGCDVYLDPDGASYKCSALDDHEITPRSLLMQRVIPIHCAFVRRRLVEKLGGFRAFSQMRHERGGDVGNVGVDIDFWYRALHFHRARFVANHTAVYQLHPDQMSNHAPCWYSNMTAMVERYEADPAYGSVFKLTAEEKKNMYVRWELLQERLNRNDARVGALVQMIQNDPGYTDETRAFLASHDFVPKPPRPARTPMREVALRWCA